MRTTSRVLAVLAMLAGVLLAGAVAPAQASAPEKAAQVTAAGLWKCRVSSYYSPYYSYEVCTRITSAPASGVQVLDRGTGRVKTLYNGNSVFLGAWYRDSSGLCGVNGDPYVWQIWWVDASGGHHHGYIGDWYLTTGSTSTWKPFPRPDGGTLGSYGGGAWSGACNRPF